MITDYHAKYFVHELSRMGGSGVDWISRALFDACVDLNPHQIEAVQMLKRDRQHSQKLIYLPIHPSLFSIYFLEGI